MKKIVEIIRGKLSSKYMLEQYSILLSIIHDMLKISIRFVNSVLNLLTDFAYLDYKQIFKLVFVFAYYSKMIVIISAVIPIPTVIVGLSTEYWKVVSTAVIGIVGFANETLRFFFEDSMSAKILEEERDYLREFSSKQVKLLEQEKTYVKDLQNKYILKTSELQGEISLKDEINKKLATENAELVERVKVSKITSKIETSEKFLMMAGNLAFILIQCLNAYNMMFQTSPVDPVEVTKLLRVVEQMMKELNAAKVNNTAFQRAQSQPSDSGSTQGGRAPSAGGLTSGDIPFEEL